MKKALSALMILAFVVSITPVSADAALNDWRRVRAIHTAAPLLMSIEGEAPGTPMYFLQSADDELILVDTAALPAKAARVVHAILRGRPGALTDQTGEYVRDGFRLTPSGLFDRNGKIADHDRFVRAIARRRVIEIVRPPKGASPAAVTGAVGGGILGGMMLGMTSLFSRCYGGCTANLITAIAEFVGVPLAAGLLTAQATRRKAETIYHA